jgi:hypothetical protein
MVAENSLVEEGKVLLAGSNHLRGVAEDNSGGGDGQGVGNNLESTLTSGVVNNDLLTLRVDVGVGANLVTVDVTEVGLSLIGSREAEGSLAKLILGVELVDIGNRSGQNDGSGSSVNNGKRSGQDDGSRSDVNDGLGDDTDDGSGLVVRFVAGVRRSSITGMTTTTAQNSIASLGLSHGGEVGQLGFGNFGSVKDGSDGSDGERSNLNGKRGREKDGSDGNSGGKRKRGNGQIIGDHTEAQGVGDVRDADLFSLRVDVRPGSGHVSVGVAVGDSSLTGVRVAEASLTQLILAVELAVDGVRHDGHGKRSRKNLNGANRSGKNLDSVDDRSGNNYWSRNYMADDRRGRRRSVFRSVTTRMITAGLGRHDQADEEQCDRRMHAYSLKEMLYT